MLQAIRRFFGLKPKAKPFSIIPTGHTLAEWRANKELPTQFKKVMDEPVTRLALSVLYNQIPTGYPLRGEAISETQAAVELGRMNGYMECLSLFQSLANTPQTTQEVEQTYGADNTDNWN